MEEAQKERRQMNFVKELQSRRALVAQVLQDRVGRKLRELTVFKGEYLEVHMTNRRWWECSNVAGQTGYVPDTILRLMKAVNHVCHYYLNYFNSYCF